MFIDFVHVCHVAANCQHYLILCYLIHALITFYSSCHSFTSILRLLPWGRILQQFCPRFSVPTWLSFPAAYLPLLLPRQSLATSTGSCSLSPPSALPWLSTTRVCCLCRWKFSHLLFSTAPFIINHASKENVTHIFVNNYEKNCLPTLGRFWPRKVSRKKWQYEKDILAYRYNTEGLKSWVT